MDNDELIPEKPLRNTIIDPPSGCIGVKTYNGFHYDENIENLKLSIRRSNLKDAIFRTLESLRTNTVCGYNTVKEILLCASLEIGPANPSLIVMIDNLIGRDTLTPDYSNIVLAVELLCISPKSNLFNLIYETLSLSPITQRNTNEITSVTTSLVYLESYLVDKHFQPACEEAFKLYYLKCNIDKELWVKLSAIFENPMRAKHLRKAYATFWLPVLAIAERCESQVVCDLIHRMYNIGCSRSKTTNISIRDDARILVLWIHAIWVLCNPKVVEDTWYDDNLRLVSDKCIMSDEDRMVTIVAHTKRDVIALDPDAINMFTMRGKMRGKDKLHYVNNCLMMSDSLPELEDEEIHWFNKLRTLLL
jgi:hypothetical protein